MKLNAETGLTMSAIMAAVREQLIVMLGDYTLESLA